LLLFTIRLPPTPPPFPTRRSSDLYLLPLTNQTLPTLLEDLDARGLLDETLVVWVGEFGRSPRINSMAGRDHWPKCYSALLAGGRSEEHTSELQSLTNLVCRLLL